MSSGIELSKSTDEPAVRRPTTADSTLVDTLRCGQELGDRLV